MTTWSWNLTFGVFLLLATGGCANDMARAKPKASDPGGQALTQGKQQGIPADPAMKLADLPNGTAIHVLATLPVYMERLSLSTSTDTAHAFFQAGGMHLKTASVDPRKKTCSLTFELAKIRKLAATNSLWVFAEGTQIFLGDKALRGTAADGQVEFMAKRQGVALKGLMCDQLTVKEVEQDVFGGKIQFYLPKN